MGGWGIPFNRPALVGNELSYVERAARGEGHLDGGTYTDAVRRLLRGHTGAADVLLTTSCTAALELAGLLLPIRPGDVVVVPSYTFVTSALAFVRAGARVRFADIAPDTLGIDPASVERLLDDDVRAVVGVHYGGVGCDVEGLERVIGDRDISLVGDNAHGLFGNIGGRPLSSHGRFTALSFHSTKNFSCGEGGALVVNDAADVDRAHVVFEKGTDRRAYLDGRVDRYTWQDVGSSFALAELLAAQLLGQLEQGSRVIARRRAIVERYHSLLGPLQEQLGVTTMQCPPDRDASYHVFHLLMESQQQRDAAIAGLAAVGIQAASHYVPLHAAPAAARFVDDRFGPPHCPVSEDVSRRVLRLPLFYELTDAEVDIVAEELVKALGR